MKNVVNYGKRGWATIVLLVSLVTAEGQVMWNLKGGLMQREYQNGMYSGADNSDDREKRLDWMAGLEMEIPLSDILNIETGVRYKNHYSFVEMDDQQGGWYDSYTKKYYKDVSSHIELPLRLTYKQQLGKYFSLHVGVGPYASYAIGDELGDNWNNNLRVGLEPSVAINWACLSLGATYNIPCFYEGFKDENKPVVMATLGIRFHSDAWKYIGATLLAIASVGTAAAAVWPSGGYGSSYSSYSSESSSYNSSSFNSSSSSLNTSNNKSSASEQQAFVSASRVYANYDSQLAMHFSGNRPMPLSDVKSIQKKMRDIRLKWEAKGKRITQVPNETR